MQSKLKLNIEINASKKAIWDVLTNPMHIKKYMFGSDLVGEFNTDNLIEWKMDTGSSYQTVVKGFVNNVIENELLEYSIIPVGDIEDIKENYLDVTHRIARNSLDIEVSDFAKVAGGEKRYNDSVQGWELVLPMIKEISESLDF